jgi:hypothetical protein
MVSPSGETAPQSASDRPFVLVDFFREVLRLELAALLVPEPDERPLVIAHDDPSVRAANEALSAKRIRYVGVNHCMLGPLGDSERQVAISKKF